MTEEQYNKATEIFMKPSSYWTGDEWSFLGALVKVGFRSRLKEIRKEVENGMQAQT